MNKITQELLDEIATYMNDDIRESLHGDYDTPKEFLEAYVEKDPDFKEILETEFNIEI